MAFVFDGINFGASDFAYSAYSMASLYPVSVFDFQWMIFSGWNLDFSQVLVALISILCLFLLSSSHGFIGIWVALTIYMSLRAFAGFWRYWLIDIISILDLDSHLYCFQFNLQGRDRNRAMEISLGSSKPRTIPYLVQKLGFSPIGPFRL